MKTNICVVQLNVVDMDQAISFYRDTLGFSIYSRDNYPQVVVLDHESPRLILNKVSRPCDIDYPHAAQTLLNFQTKNLDETLKRFAKIEWLHNEPQTCPVGRYAAFRDPFGNVHEFLELNRND